MRRLRLTRVRHAALQRRYSAPSVCPATSASPKLSEDGATVWWLPGRAGLRADHRLPRLSRRRPARSDHARSRCASPTSRRCAPTRYTSPPSTPTSAKARVRLKFAPHHHTHPAGRSRADLGRTCHRHLGDALPGRRAPPTAARLVGYLLFETASPRVVHGQVMTVTLAPERPYTFTVRALDSSGYLSAPRPESDRVHDPHAALHPGRAAPPPGQRLLRRARLGAQARR